MFGMTMKILWNVLRLYLRYRKDPNTDWQDEVERYLLALPPEEMKKFRLGPNAYWLVSRLYKGISAIAYARMCKQWPYKPMDLSSPPCPLNEFPPFAELCIHAMEREFLAPNEQDDLGILTLDKNLASGEYRGLGDSMKWHGLYVASLYRLGNRELFEKNLRAMEKITRGHLHRHASYQLTDSNPISTCSISGLAQALLVPNADDAGGLVGELRASVYAVMQSTDFFIPRMDNTPTILDLSPNIAANAVKALAYAAIKIMGDDLNAEDVRYLRHALDWKSFNPTLDGNRSFYGSNSAALLCDGILCARPELWPIVFPYLADILNHDPGVENAEVHSAIYFHCRRQPGAKPGTEPATCPTCQLKPIKQLESGVEGCVSALELQRAGIGTPFEHIADTPLPLPQRTLQDYTWQRTPYEYHEHCDYTQFSNPRLDFVAPWSRLVSADSDRLDE